MRILHERLLDELECTLEVFAPCFNRRQIVEAALLLFAGPAGLEEGVEGLVLAALIQ